MDRREFDVETFPGKSRDRREFDVEAFPGKSMDCREIQCRSILTRTSGYLKPVCSHSLNPYLGCGFGISSCGEGCYVRFNRWITRGREWGSFAEVKMNAARVYLDTAASEAKWARFARGAFAIFLASSTDPWQPAETRYRVTRQILQAMRDCPPDTLILQTHTDKVLDDLSLIETLSGICELRVHISIEGDRERLPGLPPPPCTLDRRLTALETLASRNIFAVACLSPLYPLQNADAFFYRLAAIGTRAVVIDHFIEGDGTRDGSRTGQTRLPEAMARVCPESVKLEYRDRVIGIARHYLPVGISADGFAGRYRPVFPEPSPVLNTVKGFLAGR